MPAEGVGQAGTIGPGRCPRPLPSVEDVRMADLLSAELPSTVEVSDVSHTAVLRSGGDHVVT